MPTRLVTKNLAALPLGALYGLDLRNPEAVVSEGDTWVDVLVDTNLTSRRARRSMACSMSCCT